jgi:DNA-binding MarR family transcriptional regulator
MTGKQFPDPLPDHLLRWMEALQRRVTRELMVAFESNPPIARGRQGRLLQLIPAGGQRLSELASRARVTKQALGQMVAALEDAGMVVTTVDPADGRARIVRRTAQGDAALARIEHSIARVEERLRAEIGPRRYAAMVDAMRRLGDDVLS